MSSMARAAHAKPAFPNDLDGGRQRLSKITRPRFELGLTESKSVVLPLHYRAKVFRPHDLRHFTAGCVVVLKPVSCELQTSVTTRTDYGRSDALANSTKSTRQDKPKKRYPAVPSVSARDKLLGEEDSREDA